MRLHKQPPTPTEKGRMILTVIIRFLVAALISAGICVTDSNIQFIPTACFTGIILVVAWNLLATKEIEDE